MRIPARLWMASPFLMAAGFVVLAVALGRDGSESHAAATCQGQCAEIGACSIDGDLNGATGEVLAMVQREKARDGETYTNLKLPPFTAQSLDGTEVRSSELTDRPTLLVTLAGHCRHSFQTLPMLTELAEQYESLGIQIVGLFLNSGSAEDVAAVMKDLRPGCRVLTSSNSEDIAAALDSPLLPTFFFVDETGRIKQRLVGQQEKMHVERRIASSFGLTQQTSIVGETTSGR